MTESPAPVAPCLARTPHWAIIAAIPLAGVLILHLMGRPYWCACGQLGLWIGDTLSAHNSQHLFDPYSFTHILHGFAFCALFSWLQPATPWQWRWSLVLLFESLWEILENSPLIISRYRSATAAFGYLGDTIANSCGDLLCCSLGFFIARALGFHRALAVFIATELILLWWMRDNLTLNLVMLIYPIESLKAWQLGL